MKYTLEWNNALSDFQAFLRLEKSLSENSVDAYTNDIKKLIEYVEIKNIEIIPEKIKLNHLQDFLVWINEFGISQRSQARLISGIKAFYKYFLLEDKIKTDPTKLLESPRIGFKLPEVLTIEEIDELIDAIDLSTFEGHRNKAIIETLYSCGLRVSELVNLKKSNLYFQQNFIKVEGKGSKERLVPISETAKKQINLYLKNVRNIQIVEGDNHDFVFLNNKGKKISRVMVFIIIKKLAELIGLKKNISPHTFRHSFASHLVEGGADLRAVQEMLGHESIITTEIYTHLDLDYMRDTILSFHPRTRKKYDNQL